MDTTILYLGDTSLQTAAGYLAGVMTHAGIKFTYRASNEPVDDDLLERPFKAFILSDYPAGHFTPERFDRLAKRVRNGAGLLMIGGWESFSGAGGEYTETILRDVLPVTMEPGDDRVNCPQPCLVEKVTEHAIIILRARRFDSSRINGEYNFTPYESADTLLVTGEYGKGRTCALATDVAPHWVGGFVDWGDKRVSARAEKAEGVEVGSWYAEFFTRLVRWISREL